MNISNPTTFATPDPSWSTSNSSGTSGAMRADDQLAIFSTNTPTAIASSGSTGDDGFASRLDHIHAGVVAITSTDNGIARYNGTAGQLQTYTSGALLASDAGVVTLGSGQITWPASANLSTDANTLDDYEEGVWTPEIADDDSSGTDAGQGYDIQVGRYTRIGNRCFIDCHLGTTTIGSLTGGNSALLLGLPFPPVNLVNNHPVIAAGESSALAITAGTAVVGRVYRTHSYITIYVWDATTGTTAMTITQWSEDGDMTLSGAYMV